MISGNHDSAERLSFGHKLMEESKIFISPSYQGEVEPLTLEKEGEIIDIFLLPFLKPAHVKRFFSDETIESYTEAMEVAISKMKIKTDRPSILVTHQFVTGNIDSITCESEEISVGGSDNVDASVFSPFRYVVLGHLHSPQNVGSEKIRYSGSPLKYSFSEVNHKKSVTIVDTADNFSFTTIPLIPLRDLVDITGTFEEICSISYHDNLNKDNFYRVTLKDENDIPDGMSQLRSIYPNIAKLRYDNTRTRTKSSINQSDVNLGLSPYQLIFNFYLEQNGIELNENQQKYLKEQIESTWEEKNS